MAHGDDEPDSHTYIGVPALRRFVAHLADPWTDRFGPAIEFEDFIDCGDWVVAPWSATLHGHGSGIEIEVSETYAVLVSDGRIRRIDEYRTVEQALAAVGKEKRPRREAGAVSEGGVMRMCVCGRKSQAVPAL